MSGGRQPQPYPSASCHPPSHPPTPPAEGAIGVDIPLAVKRAIGLDDAPSWVIITDYNVDEWPSRGLSPIPGRAAAFAYGFIPPGLFAKIKTAFLEVHRTGATTGVHR